MPLSFSPGGIHENAVAPRSKRDESVTGRSLPLSKSCRFAVEGSQAGAAVQRRSGWRGQCLTVLVLLYCTNVGKYFIVHMHEREDLTRTLHTRA